MEEELEGYDWEEDEEGEAEDEAEDEGVYEYEEEEPGIFRRFLRFLLRIIVVIVLGIGLGAGVFYGTQKLYRDFIATAQENRQRLDQLENDLALSDEKVETRMDQLDERLIDLEGRLAVQAETIAGLEARVERLRSVQDEHEDEVTELALLPDDVTEVEVTILELTQKVEGIEAELTALGVPAHQLQYQLQLVRTMTLLTRARVSLIHDNLGLASEDISAAVDLLQDMIEQGTPEEIETLESILKRLELALDDVRDSPVIAADELEIAWKLLIEATEFSPMPIPTATPELQPTETVPEEDSDASE
jgi:uncharacterized coiled-coil protein SlyX